MIGKDNLQFDYFVIHNETHNKLHQSPKKKDLCEEYASSQDQHKPEPPPRNCY